MRYPSSIEIRDLSISIGTGSSIKTGSQGSNYDYNHFVINVLARTVLIVTIFLSVRGIHERTPKCHLMKTRV